MHKDFLPKKTKKVKKIPSTWKTSERKVANHFQTIRRPLSGSNSGGGSDDILHKDFYVEVKHRARDQHFTTFSKVLGKAAMEKKLGILAIHLKTYQWFMVTIASDRLEEFCRKYLEMLEGK